MSLQKLLTRLANLDFIFRQLHHIKVRFFSLSGSLVPGKGLITGGNKPLWDENDLFKAALQLIEETSKVYFFNLTLLIIERDEICGG